ncbi:unnamed protein product [Alopecurus aequalis]
MVLDALASYVGDMLKKVAEEELGMRLGVSGEIDKMGDKLRDLKNFLADADRRNITDESVQEWVGQLKRAMYEATDILDLCHLKAMEHGPSTVHVHAGCFNPLLFCMRNPLHAPEVGTRIKALNKRLDTIKARSAAFNFINLGSYEDRHSTRGHASRASREMSAELDRSGVVGEKIEEDTRALVARILQTRTEANNNITVVAIVGRGGIGKTTLVQKVFNDEAIQGAFIKKIWLSINQNFSHAELLRRAIVEAGGDHRPAGDAMVALHRTLIDALIGHKTLLVMDDVWDHRAWEGVLKIPLVNAVASGSQVIITTRDEGVARGMTATWPYHHVDTLGPEDAWSLLKKQVHSSQIDEDHINTLKGIGLKIIQKCGGLPLAIKVVGGLLRKRGGQPREWEQVLDDSKWSTTKMPQELSYALYLSYEDMPPYMRQCFLYYSLLPKNRMFGVQEVIAMWISQGFIHENSNDLEESGRTCYNELVSRNLIEPDKWYIDLSVCSMHDVVRSFAHYLTRDESLIARNADATILTELKTKKFIQLSIETNLLQPDGLDWKSLKEQRSTRTLISTIQMKMNHIDLLVTFSSLRTLHIEYADVAALVELLHQLKHLRYLALLHTDISILPVNIGKMKLLQFFDIRGCKNLVNLPDSIVQLGQLRFLGLANVSKIPRGFRGLTSMRSLSSFQGHMDGDRCSLDELGPLSQLRYLNLVQLESVPAATHAANAKLGEKMHLIDLSLFCTSSLGDNGLVKEKGVSKEEQQRIEKVFDELCPPPSVEKIYIHGYFGQQLPSWMMSTSMVTLNNLKALLFSDLAFCTQLPNGLCRLPYLQFLQVRRAPCIRRVGTGFLQAPTAPFPRLNEMILIGMVEWEEWEWEEQVQAMACLEQLVLYDCKLRCVPPGLASNARALKKLVIHNVKHIKYLENFPFVVELRVIAIPDLERITNLPNLQKLIIVNCPKLKLLESVAALDKLALEDHAMEKLPEYMRGIAPRHLQLDCRLWLLASVAGGQSGPEWDKFSHVEHVKAYAPDGNNQRKWYVNVLYTRSNSFTLDSNIGRSTVFEDTLSSSMVDPQGFESVYKMRRSTFNYVCSLVRIPFFEDTMASDCTFVDGTVMSLQDLVAVALRVLGSSEPPEIVGSSIGLNKSTASLVTQWFARAMYGRAGMHHARWPYSSSEKEEIKRKFEKLHGLPNCCGVVHTAQIKFGAKSHDHEEHGSMLFQALVDPDMRLSDILLRPSDSMDQCSILQDSQLFKECENGVTLNGSKLRVSSGGGTEVGEYFVGDVGYPLRPWLLTPYQLESGHSDSDYKKEFNRRHSEATDVVMLRALARLKDTWKCLQGEGLCPSNEDEMLLTINACCMLHNIVIDMEEEEGAGMPSDQEQDTVGQVRQIADEDAVRVRDALSQHLVESGVHTMAEEEEQQDVVPAASGSGDENKEEQEARRRQKADQGKEKVHDC